MLRGVFGRKQRITAGELPGSRVKNGNESEKQNVAEQRVPSVPVPQVKHFEENRIGGMRPAAVAAAGAQMGAQRGSGRITGQQRIGQSDACVLFVATRFAQFLFQMDFELAEKTTASGTSSHNRASGMASDGAAAPVASFAVSAPLEFSAGSGNWAGSGAA
jgi:hypothetical protein